MFCIKNERVELETEEKEIAEMLSISLASVCKMKKIEIMEQN